MNPHKIIKIIRQYYLASSLLIASCTFGTWIEPVKAEGSKDLFPNGASGNRGNLVWRTNTPGGFRNRTLLRVFANAGEYITVGSSAVGVGFGDIEIYDPGTVSGSAGNESIPTTANADFVCSQQRTALGTNNGFISSRTQELAGPRSINNTGNTSGYRPCYYQAPTTGIYYVAIYGPDGKNSNSDNNAGATGSIATINTGTSQAATISAWDVTVRSSRSSTTDLEGRLHTYYVSINLGDNGRFLYSSFYPITDDGYRYQIDFRGIDPFGFRIFGNSLGNLDSDGVSPLYKDLIGDGGGVANPEGGTSSAPPQFPIFFNQIDESVLSYLQRYDPLTGTESGTGFATIPVTPLVSGATYSGNISGNRSTVNDGGTFTFDSNISGVYEIIISRDGVDFDPSLTENRVLRGLMTNGGTQTIVWDGLDNSGQPFPVGEFDYRVQIHAGEYHFPMSDTENNFNGGPTYTLLNGVNPLGNTTAFYDHRGYYTIDGTLVADRDTSDGDPTDDALCGLNPPNPASTDLTTGADSRNANFNKFGSGTGGNTNTKCTGSFGDTKTLDLWTFRPSETVAQVLEIVELDYGDAPVSYDDTADNNSTIDANDNPASHILSNNIYLGGTVADAETAPQSSTNADGDDATAPNVDDEDAFNTLPNVPSVGDYSLDVRLNTNTNATLHGWIDFDQNGKFEADEYQSVAVSSTDTTANLTWSVPVGTTPGTSYARLRLTSDTLTDDSGTTNIDERSVGSASDGEVEDYPVTLEATPIYDYGDAPDTSGGTGTGDYQTTSTNGGAAQVVIDEVGQILSLGSEIDIDSGNLQDNNAEADDNDGTPDDEDGVESFPSLTATPGQTYTVSVTASNNVPLVDAYLVGYIDFNQDGDFEDPGEQSATVTVPTGASNPRTFNVTFTTPTDIVAGNTYARFRLGQVQATAESATGASISTDNGEVEDYRVTIFPSGPAYNGFCYYTDSFEWSDYVSSGLPVSVGGIEINGGVVNTSFANSSTPRANYIDTGTQGGETGNYRLQMGSGTTNTTAGDYFDFQYTFNPSITDLSFRLIDVDSGSWIDIVTVTASFGGVSVPVTLTAEGANVNVSGNTATGTGSSAPSETLGNVRVDIDQPVDTVNIRYEAGTASGQLIWIGDFGLCSSDYSDNPPSYGDARHTISATSSLHLGTVQPDNDTATASLASAAADGDDSNNTDDEDAFTTIDTITATGNYELSVPITNTTGGAAVLHGWLDLDGDGQFSSSEHQQVLVSDAQTSANLSWTIPSGINFDSSFSRFRITTDNLVDDGNTAVDERAIIAANNGEVEDYPITLAVASDPNLILVKRITAINPGQDDEILFNTFVDDGTADNEDNDPNWPDGDDTYLPGAIRVDNIQPGDEVEYTIYFLSNGDSNANSVQVCDVIPDNMSFVSNGFDNDFGIALLNSSAAGATAINLSNAEDADEGTFYAPAAALPTVGDPPQNLCQKIDSTGTAVEVNASNNVNGAVVVEIGNVPRATAPGTPINSYGLIRFRAEVQ